MNQNLLHNVWAVSKVVFARLRFLSVFLVAGFIVGYWDDIRNHWDKWTRPAIAPDSLVASAASDIEYYCAMHPNIIRAEPGNCPICGMPLIKRKKGELVKLPDDVLSRVQLSPQRITLAGIQTTAVELRRLVRQIHAVGVLDYAEPKVAQLDARVGGRADELYIQYTGQQVKRGDKVYSLYSPDLYSAQREYLLARKRVNELPPDTSQQTRTDTSLVYNASVEKLVLWGVSREQLDEMDLEFDRAGKIPSHLMITSPIDGTVVRKEIFQGSYVNAGDRPYTIADLSALWLQIKIFERDVPLVEVGQPVQVTVDALPNDVFNGVITFKSFQLDPQTRTLDARVEVINPDMRLRPGMFADAAIAVPISAKASTQPAATQPNVTHTTATPHNAVVFLQALQSYLEAQSDLANDKQDRVASLFHDVATKLQPLADEPSVKRFEAAAERAAGQDIATVRETFKEASAALIDLGRDVGLPPDAAEVQVFRCPMKKANWLQRPGDTMNPFYGKSMQTCGAAIESLPKSAAIVAEHALQQPIGEDVLAIPRSAVIEAGRHRIVYVESSPGVYDMRAVKLGPLADEFYPVAGDLERGERVVTVGAFLIDSENRLNPAQAAPAGSSSEPLTGAATKPDVHKH